MIDWLKHIVQIEDHGCPEEVYPLSKLKKEFELRDLKTRDAYLVLNKDENWIKFAVLDFHTGMDDDIFLSCVFHGEGPTDPLRECRHTYWGDKGYLFYPNGEVISAAFSVLSEFFDDMVKK